MIRLVGYIERIMWGFVSSEYRQPPDVLGTSTPVFESGDFVMFDVAEWVPLPLVDIFLTFGPRVDRSVQKFAMGRRVDRPWTSRRITARDYYRECMRIECTRTHSHAYRTCTCERGLEQTFLYNLGTRTRWFHEQADRFYYSLVKGVCSRSTDGKVRICIPKRSGGSQHACMRQGNRMSLRVTAHDVHSRSTHRPMAKF